MKRTRPLSHHRHKAFGLFEVILVFAIVIGASAVLFGIVPSAQRAAAADHDRTMLTTIVGNSQQLYRPFWPGGSISAQYSLQPKMFGATFCTSPGDGVLSDAAGCRSALSDQPVLMGEVVTSGTNLGQGFTLTLNDLSTDQCIALLSGGQGALGAQAIQNSTPMGQAVNTSSDAVTFCTGNDNGDGYVNTIGVDYSAVGPWPLMGGSNPAAGGGPPTQDGCPLPAWMCGPPPPPPPPPPTGCTLPPILCGVPPNP